MTKKINTTEPQSHVHTNSFQNTHTLSLRPLLLPELPGAASVESEKRGVVPGIGGGMEKARDVALSRC